ncbi:lantibiotic dehydratase [Streptomyces sp. XH2]|uniref:lantibiotic dehydratase n=1 Tax=Streptomyces sp. XH2 TaxID=3412483 RepID=UPI003C7976B7
MTAAQQSGQALDLQDTVVPGTANAFAVLFGDADATAPQTVAPPPAHRNGKAFRFGSDPCVLVRAVQHPAVRVSALPDTRGSASGDGSGWWAWMSAAWQEHELVDAVRLAAPAFASELDALLRGPRPEEGVARKAALSLAAYSLRMLRPTPLGLFAGVAEGSFGDHAAVRWGGEHRVVAQAGGEWMAQVIARLEALASVRERLLIVANNVAIVRGERLVVPWQPRRPGVTTSEIREVSVRYTAQVRAVMEMAAAAVPYRDVLGKLMAQGDSEDTVRVLLDELMAGHLLISNLCPSSTHSDPLGYVIAQADRCGLESVAESADLVMELRVVHRLMRAHNRLPAGRGGARRAALVRRMTRVADADPLQVGVLLDAEVVVPRAVARDVESAVAALARVSPEPYGTAAWRAYRDRFLDRYGPHVLVPLTDLVDHATGLGLPAGFHGSAPPVRPSVSRRDARLLALVQQALADGRDLELDEVTIAALAVGDPARMDVPPHTEMLVEVHSPSRQALETGDFRIATRGLSRGFGYFSGGRFPAMLASERPGRLAAALANRPTLVEGAVPAQLTFPALRPSASNLIRCPELLPHQISLSEYREPEPGAATLPMSDLAVMCDGHRLLLVSRARQRVLEADFPHPLQAEFQTPGIARFLAELVRGQTARLTGPVGELLPFDWGAARHLPALPRLCHGRTVLSPATWRLDAADLPGRAASAGQWQEEFAALRERRGIPDKVLLTRYDMRLPLDLEHGGHLELLRRELERPQDGPLRFTEAPAPDAYGWCGRPTELVVLLRSAAPPQAAPRLRPTVAMSSPGHGHLPGASPSLCARLYGPAQARGELITRHLPRLLTELGSVRWWYRPREAPVPYLELFLQGDGTGASPGLVMQRLGEWAQRLAEGAVVADFALVPYRPHTGLWGSGPVLLAAERCFAADSTVVAEQLARAPRVDRRVLIAAHLLDFAAGFHGGREAAVRWLAAQPKPVLSVRLPRALREEAGRVLGDLEPVAHCLPDADAAARAARRRALADYRTALDTFEGHHLDSDVALRALLTEHHRRALGNAEDEGACLHLARAAAHAHIARQGTMRPSRRPR